MAQRRTGDLACSISGLLRRSRLEAKKQWSRPAAARNQSRHLGERAIVFAAVTEAALQYEHLVFDAAPLSDQHRARFKFAHRCEFKRSPGLRIGGDTIEQPARGRVKTAEHPLLHAVGDCPYE